MKIAAEQLPGGSNELSFLDDDVKFAAKSSANKFVDRKRPIRKCLLERSIDRLLERAPGRFDDSQIEILKLRISMVRN